MGLLLLGNCSVQIKDETLYWDAGPSGAVTAGFLSSGSSIIDKPAWDDLRIGMACVSADAVGDLKSEIEKLCSVCNCCTYAVVKSLKNFFTRVEFARKTASELKGAK